MALKSKTVYEQAPGSRGGGGAPPEMYMTPPPPNNIIKCALLVNAVDLRCFFFFFFFFLLVTPLRNEDFVLRCFVLCVFFFCLPAPPIKKWFQGTVPAPVYQYFSEVQRHLHTEVVMEVLSTCK